MVHTKKKSETIRMPQHTKDIYENVHASVPLNIRFGHSVHMVRLERRISQDALAMQAQVSRNYLSDLERGKRNISLEVVERIARALEIEVAELFL